MDKRFPSPESIRALQTRLKSGVSADEAEAINELLQSAQRRVEAVLPSDIKQILARLATVPAQALEVYALLQQPVATKIVDRSTSKGRQQYDV